jgi:hypothetical protein
MFDADIYGLLTACRSAAHLVRHPPTVEVDARVKVKPERTVRSIPPLVGPHPALTYDENAPYDHDRH